MYKYGCYTVRTFGHWFCSFAWEILQVTGHSASSLDIHKFIVIKMGNRRQSTGNGDLYWIYVHKKAVIRYYSRRSTEYPFWKHSHLVESLQSLCLQCAKCCLNYMQSVIQNRLISLIFLFSIYAHRQTAQLFSGHVKRSRFSNLGQLSV